MDPFEGGKSMSIDIRYLKNRAVIAVLAALVAVAAVSVMACGGTETVIQTVVVEKQVVVEKEVAGGNRHPDGCG